MTGLVSGPFADALAEHRSRFNAQFAAARRARPRLDPAAFQQVLRALVAPLVAAAHVFHPERTSTTTEALYPLALELAGQDLLGPAARWPAVVAGWSVVLPRLGRWVAEAPRRIPAAVTNALYRLSVTPGARPAEWAEALLRLAELEPDGDTLLRAGQVAAWRAGLAHYRAGALALARALPAPIAGAALGQPPDADALPLVIDRLAADPWLTPAAAAARPAGARRLAVVAQVGAFRGFGGLFVRPPIVEPAGAHFLVSDGDGVWLLTADACGATWHRVTQAPSQAGASPFRLLKDGTVRAGGQSLNFPSLADATSSAGNATTLAVTGPLTHAVSLVAWSEA